MSIRVDVQGACSRSEQDDGRVQLDDLSPARPSEASVGVFTAARPALKHKLLLTTDVILLLASRQTTCLRSARGYGWRRSHRGGK